MIVHPAWIGLVLLLGCGTTLLRRRGLAGAFLLLGLAATALLARPLLHAADGIPGPVRLLGHLAPWQGTVPVAGNPHARDVIFQIDPWLVLVREELRAGRLPLWNPFQSAGAPLWANGQSAPLFPLHLLVVALPLEIGLILLPWCRVVIAGLGVVLLARSLGLPLRSAVLAAVGWSLGGRMAAFLLYPMANALALLPWTWWAIERLARRRPHGVVVLAIVTGLQFLGGHPETVVHGAAAGALLLLARPAGWRQLPHALGGWALGAALAAVQVVPLLAFLPQTARWHSAGDGAALQLAEVGRVLTRMLHPGSLGDAAAGTWIGPFNDVATAGYLGLLIVPLGLIGLAGLRQAGAVPRLGAVLAVTFAVGFSLPGVHQLHHLVPVVGRGLAHSSVPSFHLALCLLAAFGLERWLAGSRRPAVFAAVATLAAVSSTVVFLRDDWHVVGVDPAIGLLALTLAAVALAALPPKARARHAMGWATLVVVATVVDLSWRHGHTLGWGRLAELYPQTPATIALERVAGADYRVAGLGETLRPNGASVLRLRDVRGDDTLELTSFDLLSERFAPPHPTFFTPIENWDDPALDALAVAAVIGPPLAEAPSASWELLHDGADARVWRRPGAHPLVRLDGNLGRIEVLTATPGHWRVAVDTPGPTRLVVAEMAAAGWSATPRPLVSEPHGLLAVDVTAGQSVVELRYRPSGLLFGVLLSFLAASLCGVMWRFSQPTDQEVPSP